MSNTMFFCRVTSAEIRDRLHHCRMVYQPFLRGFRIVDTLVVRGALGSTPQSSISQPSCRAIAWYWWSGRFSTVPPACGPMMFGHQRYLVKLSAMRVAIAYEALPQRYSSCLSTQSSA